MLHAHVQGPSWQSLDRHGETDTHEGQTSDEAPSSEAFACPPVGHRAIHETLNAYGDDDPERNEIRIVTRTKGDEVLAEIRDTGCGIPAEHLDHVFEPFFTTKEATGAAGLGLAISHDILCSVGGRFEVTSNPGEGTRFVLRFPALRAEAPSPTSGEPAAADEASAVRILVIDDEPAVRRVLTRALGKHYDVVAVESAENAQELLVKDHRFDVVLCDLMMPGMSGVALHEWLRGVRPENAERMMFMTGGAFTPMAREAIGRASVPVLEKPFDAGQALRSVQEVLARLGPLALGGKG